MHDATQAPRRMRYSFEARCRAVQAMVDGQSPSAAAASVGASRATGYRWWRSFETGGWGGLRDPPSTPIHQPRRLSREVEAEIVAARERSQAGTLTLSGLLNRPASTIGKVLRRLGRSRLPREPRPPVVRYERERPGELLHIDTKKLGRFWHVGKRILRDGVQRSPPAGSTSTSPFPPRLRRGAAHRPCGGRAGVPRARAALVRRAGRCDRGGHDRQRLGLPLARLAATLRRVRAGAPPHPALHPTYQRQGRALHPAAAQALGLRLRLPDERASHPRPRRLAQVVQPT